MRSARALAGALLLAVSVVAGVEASRMAYWSSLGPGPGFFPLWLAGLLGMLSLLLLARAFRSAGAQGPVRLLPDKQGRLKMVLLLAALLGAVLLLERLGFCLTVLAMYLVVLYGFGRRDLVVTPLIAVGGSFGVYHVFTKWLNVPLPVGVFGW